MPPIGHKDVAEGFWKMLHAFIFIGSFRVSHQSSKRKILIDKSHKGREPNSFICSHSSLLKICLSSMQQVLNGNELLGINYCM